MEFEKELIRQFDIDIPYILALVKKYHDSNCEDADLIKDIIRCITSSPKLRDKKDLIEGYLQVIKEGKDVDVYEVVQNYFRQQMERELKAIICEENLK